MGRGIRTGITVLLGALLLFAAGCSSMNNSGVAAIDVNQVTDQVVKATQFKDQMSAVEQKTAEKLYGLSDDTVVKAKAYESTGATAEEVAAFEAKDETAAKTVLDAVNARVENQKAGFAGYQPKEMTKLQSPLILQEGKYVFLCVADDTSQAKQVITDAAKR